MRIRVDIFPTPDSEVAYRGLSPASIAERIQFYGTTDATVDLTHDGEVHYIHFKRIIRNGVYVSD
jgi:hypothetical protein